MGIFKAFRSKTTQALANEVAANQGNGGNIRVSAPTHSTNAPARSVTLRKESAPATQRSVVLEKGGVDLAKKFDKAGISLSKRNLDGIRAEAVLIADYSGSMHRDYANGTVQKIVERALGFSLQIDIDGKIPVIRFGSDVFEPVEVTMANYQNVTATQLTKGMMGSTNLAAALRVLLDEAAVTESPIFAVIVTDGAPDSEAAVETLVRQLSHYPVFLKFVSIQPVSFLKKLDKLPGRLVDNVNSQHISDVQGMTDSDFAEAMTAEWDKWIAAATLAGVLR
ncbi:hypothetical protein CJ179_38780 [Rhodococcus sp. ACS1]|uniref:VWA domain-containing protein n=1 Tax=Rhodococcus sp. ACS1 TaxID=2028570 RepID=UPI000BB0ED99|nr:VWA domain-containing protein [Rhodococcus sp. ACS1]PBC38545.1 hypothetical protein CJ179_38780 [Rhodococcus sp. ACS1]